MIILCLPLEFLTLDHAFSFLLVNPLFLLSELKERIHARYSAEH